MSIAAAEKPKRVKRRPGAGKNGNKNGSGGGRNGRLKAAVHTQSDYLDPEQLLAVLTAVKKGDFSSRLSGGKTGTAGKIQDALNEIIEKNELLTSELNRISEVVGKEGKIAQRAAVANAS